MLQTQSLNSLPVSQRLDGFTDLVCHTLCPMGCAPLARAEQEFEGEIQTQQPNQLGLMPHAELDDCVAHPQQYLDISTRYLHMLCESQGESVSRYTGRSRLDACKAALDDPEPRDRSVSAIAYPFGLSDTSHSSRIFKAQFGVPPARYRKDCSPSS